MAGKAEPSPNYSSAESEPLYLDPAPGGFFKTVRGRIVMVILVGILLLMFLLALALCLAKAIMEKNARHFALLINIVLSTVVTGLLILWLYRGVMAASLVWYVFVQCVFLFFQLVTTDVFAWYEPATATTTVAPVHPTRMPSHPSPTPSCSPNQTNCTTYRNPWHYQHPVEW